MKSRFLLLASLAVLGLYACKDKYAKEPAIEFMSVSKSFMTQNGVDSMQLRFSFVDGDGDIGNEEEDNVFVSDARTNQLVASYRIPEYTPNPKQTFRKGEISLVVYAQCCIYPDSTSCYVNAAHPLDTLRYLVQVRDKAGNWSNVIETSPVVLDCD